jgi:hypothetical protein
MPPSTHLDLRNLQTADVLCFVVVVVAAIAGDIDDSAESICKLLVALGEHSSDYLALNLGQPQVQVFYSLMLGYTGIQGYYGIDEEISEVRLLPLAPLVSS